MQRYAGFRSSSDATMAVGATPQFQPADSSVQFPGFGCSFSSCCRWPKPQSKQENGSPRGSGSGCSHLLGGPCSVVHAVTARCGVHLGFHIPSSTLVACDVGQCSPGSEAHAVPVWCGVHLCGSHPPKYTGSSRWGQWQPRQCSACCPGMVQVFHLLRSYRYRTRLSS